MFGGDLRRVSELELSRSKPICLLEPASEPGGLGRPMFGPGPGVDREAGSMSTNGVRRPNDGAPVVGWPFTSSTPRGRGLP